MPALRVPRIILIILLFFFMCTKYLNAINEITDDYETSLKQAVQQFLNEGSPTANISEKDLVRQAIITNINSGQKVTWIELKQGLPKCRTKSYTIIIPGIKSVSTLQGKTSISDNDYINSLKMKIKCQYYIDLTNLYNNSLFDALRIYKNFKEKLIDIMPKNISSIHIVLEGVAAPFLAAVVKELKKRTLYVSLTAFNPLLFDFLTNDYDNIKLASTEFIIGAVESLSETEFKSLYTKNLVQRVWFFINTLDCKENLCSYQKTSTMKAMITLEKLKNFQICKVYGNECFTSSFDFSSYGGVYQFTKISSRENMEMFKDQSIKALKELKNDSLPNRILNGKDLNKLIIKNLNTNQKTKWTKLREEFNKCIQKSFTIIIPGIEILSTLQNRKIIPSNDYINLLKNSSRCQYYIETMYLYNNSIYNALTMYKSFGDKLGEIFPEGMNRIHLIGEGVSALALAVTAKNLKSKSSNLSKLTIFNPILLDNFRNDYKNITNFFTEFVIGDVRILKEGFKKFIIPKPEQRIWLFSNIIDCGGIFCYIKRTSSMYMMILKNPTKIYKICDVAYNYCSNNISFYESGVFNFTKRIMKFSHKYNITTNRSADLYELESQEAAEKFIHSNFSTLNLTENDLVNLVIQDINNGKMIEWIDFKKELQNCGSIYGTLIIPGIKSVTTLKYTNYLTTNDYIKLLKHPYKCQYYIDTTDLYKNSVHYALRIYESFGQALSKIIPSSIFFLELYGEGVSFPALATLANTLDASKHLVHLTGFNPLTFDFLTKVYRELKSREIEIIFGAVKPLSNNAIYQLQTIQARTSIWVLTNITDCEDLLCCYHKTSTMRALVHLRQLKNYEVCKMYNNTCVPQGHNASYNIGTFKFTKMHLMRNEATVDNINKNNPDKMLKNFHTENA